MRGHIVKRYKNSYTIVLNLGVDPATGKRKQQWVSVKGIKKDAEKRLAELLHQLDTGVYLNPGRTTVTEYFARWLSDYAKPNLSPRGFERYSGIVYKHILPAFGRMQLIHLKPEHLQKCYTESLNAGLNPQTVRHLHGVIHIALQTAVKWGLLSRNVADAVQPPRKTRTEIQTWNEDEVTQFLEGAKKSPYYALFYTALFTGMRRSELLALAWGDIDLLFSQIYVNRGLHQLKDGSFIFTQPKSEKSRRSIALSPSTFLVLNEYRKEKGAESLLLDRSLTDTDLVFSSPEGKPLRPNTITRAWSMLAEKCGVKRIRLHDARHTHATLMLKQGIHPKVVQERLGHSSINITLDIYSHVTPGLQEAAAKRFDDLICRRPEKHIVK
jgi:integrase